MKLQMMLLDQGVPLNEQDSFGRTPLYIAAKNNNISAASEIIKHCTKEQINIEDAYGRRALHAAAEGNATDIMRELLRKGAELEALDSKNRTALHLAGRENRFKAINYLVNRGANLHLRDIENNTPERVAKNHSHYKAAEILRDLAQQRLQPNRHRFNAQERRQRGDGSRRGNQQARSNTTTTYHR